MYLVDTNVLATAAPTTAVPRTDVRDWMERNTDALYLSVVAVVEVEDGIARSRRAGAFVKADRLAAWLEAVIHLYSSRILPIDVCTARHTGIMADFARGRGHDPGFADLAVAATALTRGYVVLTRNLRHFAPLGVPVHDPFLTLPANMRA